MRKIHGASLHRGRNPEYSRVDDNAALPIKEEERLEAELAKAIAAEDFERAAELRDKLRTVREKVGVEEVSKG
jgi:protein arginine kinase activator